MRILILSPNTTAAVTAPMVDAGREVAAAGTQFAPMNATVGFSFISSRAEARIGGADVQSEDQEPLVALANQAVADLRADLVIFGGAPRSCSAWKVRDHICVLIVDPIAAAEQAEVLVTLDLRKALVGSTRRPDAKPSVGLSPGLAGHMARGRRPTLRQDPDHDACTTDRATP